VIQGSSIHGYGVTLIKKLEHHGDIVTMYFRRVHEKNVIRNVALQGVRCLIFTR